MPKHIFNCIDGHTCGNPVRLVVKGGPELRGATMSEKRQHFLQDYDWIRQALMFEPRGHDMMSGSILYPPANPDYDSGVLFIETSGCLPMCGHGTIGTVTTAIQEGIIIPKVPGQLMLEVPAGEVKIRYEQKGSKVTSVRLTNVPSYLAATDLPVDCPDLGLLKVDVAYGGNFYAIVDVQKNFPGLQYFTAADLLRWSPVLRKQLNAQHTFVHPLNPTIKGLSHLLWTGQPLEATSTARNAVFYGDKAIDRSPCGTGTSARMAQWAAKGLLTEGMEFVHESFIGSKFIGRIEGRTKVGSYEAIIPSIEGWAVVTGYNQITVDPEDDPFALGFQVI